MKGGKTLRNVSFCPGVIARPAISPGVLQGYSNCASVVVFCNLMFRAFRALVIVAAVAGLGQSATVPAHSGTVSVQKKVIPDAQIERTIRAKLAKSKINADHFTVSVQNGVATFEGKTSVIQHKGVATRMAHTSGALAVQNHIQISEEAKAKAAAKLAKYRDAAGGPVRATVVQAKK